MDGDDGVTERLITQISPKQQLPNAGAPEIVEQKSYSPDEKQEQLISKIVNLYDDQGAMIAQQVYDANEKHCYTTTKGYEKGLLSFETDPIDNETHYSYDANRNLISESHSNTGITIEYGYDLKNRLISTAQQDRNGSALKHGLFLILQAIKSQKLIHLEMKPSMSMMTSADPSVSHIQQPETDLTPPSSPSIHTLMIFLIIPYFD